STRLRIASSSASLPIATRRRPDRAICRRLCSGPPRSAAPATESRRVRPRWNAIRASARRGFGLQYAPTHRRAVTIFRFSGFQDFPPFRERGESMFRTSDIVLIGVMVAAAAMTYSIKRDAGEQLAAVRKLQTQIRTEEETIDLLKADW